MHQRIHFFLGTTIFLMLASCSPSSTLELKVQPHNATNPFDNAGEVISYSYVVNNTGTVPLHGPVLIADDKMQVGCSNLIDVGNKDQSLDPSEEVTCTSTYTITQADLDAGAVDNNSIAKVGETESNRVSNIVKLIQTIQSTGFSEGSTIQHIVVPGEWLLQIARCYGADFNEVSIANPQVTDPHASLDSMILTIPKIGSVGPIYGPPCVVFRTVQAGDTWDSIAQKYNADRVVLQAANSDTTFSVGTRIKVPLNSVGSPPPPKNTSPEEKVSLVDDILKQSYTGGLTYTTPTSMTLDETFPIKLYLTPSLSEGEFNSLAQSSGLVSPSMETDTLLTTGGEEVKITSTSKIEITPVVMAVLSSEDDQDAFGITSDAPDDVAGVTSNSSASWQWRIESKKPGPQRVVLKIYRLVKFDGVDDWRQVEEFNVDIDVNATLSQRFQMLADWKWIAGLLITLLIVPAFWRWHERRNEKPGRIKSSRQDKLIPESLGNIFISYRRSDSADIVGRIYDRLIEEFGRNPIFKDVDSIPFGIDFREYLDKRVGECNVLLAVIGDHWIDAKDATGNKRLEDSDDFVRVEIESALERGIPIIPLLVRGAQMPPEEQLPPTLKKLVYRNGIQIRSDPDFHNDMNRLIVALEQYIVDAVNS